MELKLVDIKDPVLRQKAKTVSSLDKKTKKLITDMRETLKAQKDPEGVGLAAPQVGKSLQLFMIDYKKNNLVVMNPEIVSISDPQKAKLKDDLLEGCLSLPHYYGPLKRSNKITIKYKDENWQDQEREFKGFMAQIVQHELDHLKGTLFIDRILEQSVPLYKFDGEDWEEVELS